MKRLALLALAGLLSFGVASVSWADDMGGGSAPATHHKKAKRHRKHARKHHHKRHHRAHATAQ